ncbi:MAG TPA: hypothetical protein VFK06_21615, partial [Candidatus Angelobacter sp.]|nr:hypothetical protein [Candidatus Angelobacter sp.]
HQGSYFGNPGASHHSGFGFYYPGQCSCLVSALWLSIPIDSENGLNSAAEPNASLIEVAEEWSATSDEDLKAGWLYEILTHELLSDSADQTGPVLSSSIRVIVAAAREEHRFTEVEFNKLCINSRSPWDRYTRQVTPDLPTHLSDTLFMFLKAWHFKTFWTSVLHRVTDKQRDELTVWYTVMARTRAKRNIAPSYFRLSNSEQNN